MNSFLTKRNLTITNFAVVGYFLLLYLINYYRINFVVAGVLQELLTIPFLLAQPVLLFFGVRRLFRTEKKRILLAASIVLVAISTALTFGSLFHVL